MTRPNSLLTDEQRQYLTGELTYEGEYARQKRYQRRTAIRKRVYHGLRDGLLLGRIDDDDRAEIFEYWNEASDWRETENREESVSHEHYDVAASREHGALKRSFIGWIKFLYLGTEVTDWEFGNLLKTAVRQVEGERNRAVERFEYTVETNERDELDVLMDRFESGDPELDHFQIKTLKNEGRIDGDDIMNYYDRLEGRSVDP